jgi:prepilin-type N-terminal cleavage/methylation domain-containing protein
MRIAANTREMKTARINRIPAFTLIELLIVIAIIAVVAGLVVGLAGAAGGKKRTARTQTELAKIVTLIEAYKAKVGVYPPDNPSEPDRNSLFYELAGTIRDRGNVADPSYETLFDKVAITSNQIWAVYGGEDVFPADDRNAGFLNAVEKERNADDAKVHPILTDLKPDQYAMIAGHRSLVVPVDGPNGRPNPWSYLRAPNAIHNPDSYDLWVDIVAGGKTNRIGNWKN